MHHYSYKARQFIQKLGLNLYVRRSFKDRCFFMRLRYICYCLSIVSSPPSPPLSSSTPLFHPLLILQLQQWSPAFLMSKYLKTMALLLSASTPPLALQIHSPDKSLRSRRPQEILPPVSRVTEERALECHVTVCYNTETLIDLFMVYIVGQSKI